MNYTNIIMLIGILVGILLFKKTNPIFLKGLLLGLILSFALSFFQNSFLKSVSYISFGLIALVYTIISGRKKKWLNLVISFFVFLSLLFKFNHLAYANELQLGMIIPIICFALVLKDWKTHLSELSILSIFFAYEITEFIQLAEL